MLVPHCSTLKHQNDSSPDALHSHSSQPTFVTSTCCSFWQTIPHSTSATSLLSFHHCERGLYCLYLTTTRLKAPNSLNSMVAMVMILLTGFRRSAALNAVLKPMTATSFDSLILSFTVIPSTTMFAFLRRNTTPLTPGMPGQRNFKNDSFPQTALTT
ncbi:hypothetical protein C349_04530 [Cryptococcus neoformans var. grubii Br795]|nr:hypothetical protein C353_04502 [Cryptococcus neoformans var. grubii AD1-83a]OXG48360.1 hypothetical protein C355_04307 [Cryptococcus neoformans var. grubii Th84]OXG55659.1 hypothetical protein C354_04435 [Cryptococcus neoformans var. grubii MW-RSA1955]OXG59354.1 hypothetical protein C352_04423 [Cryptococcus neoformans var. grubii CHC193]OXG61469.1 hypothetical protein C351_04386 [Cryptococcus neoformans var. grubii c8]OXG79146.1 hypothetical protein C349_04530 [Cryptococcus neoformans var.